MPQLPPIKKPTREDFLRARDRAISGARATHQFVTRRKRFFQFWIVRIIVLLVGFTILSAGSIFLWIAIQPIPSIKSFEDRKIENSTIIYDNTGKVPLYNLGDNIQRQVVPIEVVSPYIKNGFVAIEDKNFYEHHGVVLHSTIRGIVFTLLSQFGVPVDGSGGSTITQQVVKNTLLTNEQKYSRKLKEWFLAVKLEKKYSKEEILGIYLNEIPFGGNLYGIEAASQAFFGVDASKVTLAQAAYLSAIPNAPTYFSPYGKHLDKLDERKNLVLSRMRNINVITEVEYQEALKEKVTFRPRSETRSKAIHFVEYVRQELIARYGSEAVENEGMRVISTLDWRLQEKAEESAAKHALENETAWNASNQALVAIDPKTGGILAMVGSRGYSDEKIDGKFNVATALRQPGSSFKPFIYAKAFDMGYTDQTVIFDLPIQFSTSCSPTNYSTTANGSCYSPDNYDGKFMGPMSLRNALAQSRNIPAVKMMYLVGPKTAIQFARTLGINSLANADQYGLTLVLGGGEASLLDMTAAYSVFANDGVRVEPTAITRIENATGKVLYEHTPVGTPVLSSDAARRLSSVLSDNAARTPLFGANSLLYFGSDKPVAAKTGTTNNNKDAWLIGYTPDVAIGVWSGNNDNTPMKKGSIISAPTWRDAMNTAISLYGYHGFPAPNPIAENVKPVLRGKWWGNETIAIDEISGKLATEFTPPETRKEFVIPEAHTILHWVQRADPTGAAPSNPESDPQYSRWESAVRGWVANHPDSIPAMPVIPTDKDDVHLPEYQPTVSITNTRIQNNNGIPELVVNYSISDNDLAEVHIAVNGNTLAQVDSNATQATVQLPEDVQSSGNIEVIVEAIDAVWNRGSARARVNR